MKKILKITLFIILTAAVSALGFTVWAIGATKDAVFDDKKLKNGDIGCEVYFSDGEKIPDKSAFQYVKSDELPKYLTDAFIAIEDKRFYSHNGIDLRAIGRALFSDLTAGKIKEGGSTISQQLVKNAFLSGEKTLTRKLKEMKLTRELERNYSKAEILEMYLNTVYFGNGCNGISSAANAYFGKKPKDLTVGESASLAAIVKSPARYDPFKNPDELKKRRDLVLSEMKKQNLIGKDVEKTEISKELSVKKKDFTKDGIFSDVADMIKNRARNILGYENVSDLNGYKIKCALNKETTLSLPDAGEYVTGLEYTALVIENASGRIIAERTTADGIKRCPASAIKPCLIYAPAIETGEYTEATKILDEKTKFGDFEPSNYGDEYYGYVNLKESLSKSLNVPSVKIAETLGLAEIKKYAKKLGITYENDDLSVALGNLSGGITAEQLASSYLPFSGNGIYKQAFLIVKIENEKGITVYKRSEKEEKVFTEETAFIINDMLKSAVKTGTAKKLNCFDFDICAKTGTNGTKQGNTDAYCVAYTSKHTVLVWLGKKEGLTDNSVSGSTYPSMIARDIIKNLYKDVKPQNFSAPSGVVFTRIDKNEYDLNHKIFLSEKSDRSSVGFWFLKGTEPSEKAGKKEITPNIKSYKIDYKNKKIIIDICPMETCGYTLFSEEKEIYSGTEAKRFEFKDLVPDAVYRFYIIPFLISDGITVKGEKITLPSVKTEGKEGIKNTPWWED